MAEIELVMNMCRANEEFGARAVSVSFTVGDEATMMAIGVGPMFLQYTEKIISGARRQMEMAVNNQVCLMGHSSLSTLP